MEGDDDHKNNNEKEALKNAISEAEPWMQRFDELKEKSAKKIPKSTKPPPYKKIKLNKVVAKLLKLEENEYNECQCRPDDPAPCTIENNCYNALLSYECDPDLCPAKEKCQNQNFRRGEQYAFEVKMTETKGWGLFAKQEIPIEKFVIEYMGEVIDSVNFDQRFNRATANKDDNYYFLTLGKMLYIDAKDFGNEARFINHSCDPNVAPKKWSVFANGQEQIRIGFFSCRTILPVCKINNWNQQPYLMIIIECVFVLFCLQGEEITFDYNWGTKKIKTAGTSCQCGAACCRGHI